MEQLLRKIKSRATEIRNEVVQNRRHLHRNPELSFHEYNTATYIEEQLRSIGITDFERKGTTGVIALVKGKNDNGKVTALRADIDALPILEQNDIDYRSQNDGVMHACGHDVHTSSLLGSARILHELRDEFEGTIKLIFQPGEEKIPGGASILIKEGVLEKPKVHQIIGQHVMPQLPTGKIGFRKGLYMASSDEIYMTVKGKGGHGAMPQFNLDPIVITSHIITALQQVVSRFASPLLPTVLSFGKIIGMGATNVIPNEVIIEGTFRTLNEEWRATAHEKIIRMAKGMAESMGATCDIEIRKGYPFLKNDETLTEATRNFATQYVGQENIVDLDIWMASEDFAFYSQEIPACFYRLGTGNEQKKTSYSVHTPTFNVDEDALEVSTGLMAWLGLNQLRA